MKEKLWFFFRAYFKRSWLAQPLTRSELFSRIKKLPIHLGWGINSLKGKLGFFFQLKNKQKRTGIDRWH
jgi:hypothetical protein